MFFAWALQASSTVTRKKAAAAFINPAFNRSYVYNTEYLEDRKYVNGTSYWKTSARESVPEKTERMIKEKKVKQLAP